jgi:hypothetical protein
VDYASANPPYELPVDADDRLARRGIFCGPVFNLATQRLAHSEARRSVRAHDAGAASVARRFGLPGMRGLRPN